MVRKYSEKPAIVTVKAEESQLDRIEKKVDRILHTLENGELSTSLAMDAKELKEITQSLDDRYTRNLRRCGLT